METITNAASTAATTVSNLIYGQPNPNAKDNETTISNETAGKEPLSGEQGKGTVTDPFDKGNSENPVDASSKSEDFLKLNPALGKPATTDSSTDIQSGTTSESAIPILPLAPDTATDAGVTEKTGITDKTYKETPLDAIKLSGAPGAGPSAPDVTPATGETNVTSTTSSKASEQHGTDTAKDSTTAETHQDSSAPKTKPVDSEIDAILNKGSLSKADHSVNDGAAQSPHSKMNDKTVRQTDASKSGESGESKNHVAENAGRKSESSKSTEPTSSTGGEEKSGKKMSALKEKLKDKLHIGSKDK